MTNILRRESNTSLECKLATIQKELSSQYILYRNEADARKIAISDLSQMKNTQVYIHIFTPCLFVCLFIRIKYTHSRSSNQNEIARNINTNNHNRTNS